MIPAEPAGAGNGGLADLSALFALFVVIGFRAVPDLYRYARGMRL
jgi:hypothetical protein